MSKTTLVRQVTGRILFSTFYASADEPTLRSIAWIGQQWDAARLKVGAGEGVLILCSAPLLIRRGLSESLAGRFEIVSLGHWSAAEMKELESLVLRIAKPS